jgi:hypothetical protein
MKRQHLHTRTIEFNSYRREDGLFDIEARMRDVRQYESVVLEHGLLPAGRAVHDMTITATIDEQMAVRAITTRMLTTPFVTCLEIEQGLQAMLGARMARGWRRAVNERLGSTGSCTHLRELLVNMGTAALQTVPIWYAQQHFQSGKAAAPGGTRPTYLGQCHGWKLDGPMVLKHFPQFFQPASPAADKG